MSVDTYLKGKSLGQYQRIQHGDVELYVSPSMLAWAKSARVGVRNWVIRKTVSLAVEHRHTAACRHG